MTVKVGDDAVFQWPNRRNVARRASQHVLGFHTDRLDDPSAASRVFPNGDNGRLVEHDAGATRVDQRICRAQIDRQVIGKITQDILEHAGCGPERRLTA